MNLIKKSFSRIKGITLVEILVALAVSSLLSIGIIQIFIGSKNTYNVQEGLSRLQENARFVLDYLSRDIRMANFLGCAQRNYNSKNVLVSSSYKNILNNSSDFLWDYRAGIQGFEATSKSWIPDLDSRISDGDPTVGNDIISIKILRGSGVTLSSDMPDVEDEKYGKLEVNTNSALPPRIGDITLITDCTKTTVFQVSKHSNGIIEHAKNDSGLHLTPGNSTNNLGYQFLKGSKIFPVETVTYYLKNSVLWRQVDDGNAQQLIEGVESLQLTYGLDTAGNDERADRYFTADAVQTFNTPPEPIDPIRNWRRVVSVRVGLLMRTTDEVTPRSEEKDTTVYNVNGEVIDPPDDHRLRRIFTTTIALRNRTP